ncbi:hypothetical protein Tco_0929891 [Tanacetum coccineum]
MFASRFASRMDMLSGPLAIGKWKNISMNLEDDELKDESLKSKAIFKESKRVDEESSENARTHCSPNDERDDFERTNNDYETQENEGWFDEHKLTKDDDDDIGDLEDYLIHKDPPYYVN